MKKFLSLLLALFMTLPLAVTAFADLGDPDFKDWYVICGMNGCKAISEDYVVDSDGVRSEDEVITKEVTINPGERCQVWYYRDRFDDYMIMTEKYSMLFVKTSQLNNDFLKENEAVSESYGTKLSKPIEGEVNAVGGLVLRQGPSKNFPKFDLIPNGTTVSCSAMKVVGDLNWGYVNYKGKNGWICIDYVNEITTTKPTTTTTTAATTENSTTKDTEPAKVSESETASELTNEDIATEKGSLSLSNIMLICSMFAIVIALAGVVVIIIIKKKNKFKQ